MKKISPFLWYDNQAEEAVKMYVEIFSSAPNVSGNTKVGSISRYTGEGAKASGQPDGSVMTVAFELAGEQFTAINGGPVFKFTEAISFTVSCEDQAEIDHYWDKLSAGGDPKSQQCGWLKDKFGLSWQIVPSRMGELMSGGKGEAVMKAMLAMKKIEIAKLEEAAQE